MLLTNDGSRITEQTFLNAFAAASRSTPFETARAIIEQYKKFLSEEELAELERLSSQAVTTYLEG